MSNPNLDAIDAAIQGAGLDSDSSIIKVNVASDANDPNNYTPNLLNKADIIEFDSRYFSLDAMNARADGSDLAYIRILNFKDGKFGSQVFPNNGKTYKQFIVTNISKGDVEKAQIIKTNNTLQIYGFDSQPEVINIQGVLKSTTEDRWDIAMLLLWDDIFRLTKLIQANRVAELGYESNIYWGYPLNFQTQKSSNMAYIASFSMQFLIIKRSIVIRDYNAGLFDIIDQIKVLNQGPQLPPSELVDYGESGLASSSQSQSGLTSSSIKKHSGTQE